MTQMQRETVRVSAIRTVLSDGRSLAGVLFFALAAQFMTVIMLAAAMVPGYDFNAAAISDLGVFPETAMLFNVSLVVVGVFNLLGGYAFYRTHGKRWLFALFGVAGLGAIVAGLFPLGTSDLHSLGALLAFLFFNLQAIGSATRAEGPMKVLSVLLGLAGLVFVVLMVVGDGGNTAVFGPIGHGGTERMIVYPPMMWLVAFGGYLMASTDGQATTADTTPAGAD
ncbi:DUF998 domain-containing protein [Haloferax sp. MBLA0076]|uniref:DUF998 domain-containing protein n=1 Tax=Haloferax litoreum TaxID=2666140 RepID=A0A6A8GGM0_9EURY|nr:MULTISPECIES: DUF998 domain-containing protein [Haloferax]KAB1193511.1 DUF998 domain-containing protein [Haloferax sp. CBA1148]MRX22026.1 DUF998 domain-containing protein [Haloferax litoreum]